MILGILEIAVKYELQKAADNAQVSGYISEREVYDGESMNLIYAVNFSNETILPLLKNLHFQKDGCTFKVTDDYATRANFGSCMVTNSCNENIKVGTMMTLHYKIFQTSNSNYTSSITKSSKSNICLLCCCFHYVRVCLIICVLPTLILRTNSKSRTFVSRLIF